MPATTHIKISLITSALTVSLFLSRNAQAQTNRNRMVNNWETEELVGVEAVAIDHDGNIYAAQRCQANWSNTCASSLRPPIVEFDPSGKVIMTLGKAGVHGDGPDTFHAPNSVVVAPNGDIFVADGHGGDTNARIVRF